MTAAKNSGIKGQNSKVKRNAAEIATCQQTNHRRSRDGITARTIAQTYKTMDNMLECEKKRRRSRDVSQQIIAEVANNRTDIKTMENIMM